MLLHADLFWMCHITLKPVLCFPRLIWLKLRNDTSPKIAQNVYLQWDFIIENWKQYYCNSFFFF